MGTNGPAPKTILCRPDQLATAKKLLSARGGDFFQIDSAGFIHAIPSVAAPIRCPHCGPGNRIPDHVNFCGRCGRQITHVIKTIVTAWTQWGAQNEGLRVCRHMVSRGQGKWSREWVDVKRVGRFAWRAWEVTYHCRTY